MSLQRNNNKPHRNTPANRQKTLDIIEKFHGKEALLRTWELQPDKVQIKNHDYIIKQRANVRMIKNLIQHRATPESDL